MDASTVAAGYALIRCLEPPLYARISRESLESPERDSACNGPEVGRKATTKNFPAKN
jgi:hypothetical protein